MTAEFWGFLPAKLNPRSPLSITASSAVPSPLHTCLCRFIPLSELRHVSHSRSHPDPAPPAAPAAQPSPLQWGCLGVANSHSPAAKAPRVPSWGCVPSSTSPGHRQCRGKEPQTGARAFCMFGHNLRDDEHVQSYKQNCLDKQKCPRGSPVWCLDAYWGAKSPAAACLPMLPAWPQPAGAPCPSLRSTLHPRHLPSDQLQPLPVTASHAPTPCVPHKGEGTEHWGREAAKGSAECRCTEVPCATPSPPVPFCPTSREAGLPLPPRPSPLTRHRALYAPI